MDLNSDLGEGFGPWSMGDDAAMLGVVTSANIACGGHASDPDTMFDTLRMAAERGVVIGAHPGYADPLGFGRRVIPMEPVEIARMVAAQVGALQGVAALVGAKVAYVKAHGALANLAADRRDVADAIAMAVKALPGGWRSWRFPAPSWKRQGARQACRPIPRFSPTGPICQTVVWCPALAPMPWCMGPRRRQSG